MISNYKKELESESYKICSKTIMDTTDPGITFNEKGECNYYTYFIKNIKEKWETDPETKRLNLERSIDKIKKEGKGKEFDCIIGISGGLDSSYMLHEIVKNYDLRPLVFHVDGGWNSEIASHNISVMINKLNIDLFTEVINWEEMRDFQLAMFKSGLPGIDVPQDIAFIETLYKFASKYKIKTILNGGNISTEVVTTPIKLLYWGGDTRLIKDVLKTFGTKDLETFPLSSIFYRKIWLRFFEGIRTYKPLNDMTYIKKDAIETLEKEYGWKRYLHKHYESRFTAFFEGFWLNKRFNYDMRRREFSSLILTGQMNRAEAYEKIKLAVFNKLDLKNEFRYVANKLQISIEDLEKYLYIEKKYFYNYKNNHRIINLGAYILNKTTGQTKGGAI